MSATLDAFGLAAESGEVFVSAHPVQCLVVSPPVAGMPLAGQLVCTSSRCVLVSADRSEPSKLVPLLTAPLARVSGAALLPAAAARRPWLGQTDPSALRALLPAQI